MMLAAIPGPLVHGFFLTPDNRFQIRILNNQLIQIILRERVQLLYANNNRVVPLIFRR